MSNATIFACLLLALLVQTPSADARSPERELTYRCSHDHIFPSDILHNRTAAHQSYTDHPFESAWNKDGVRRSYRRRRILAVANNIRIYADFTYTQLNDPQKLAFLQNKLIPGAVNHLSSALRVIPVQGNLKLQTEWCDSLVRVPDRHITVGVPDTDYVLYVTTRATDAGVLAYALPCLFDQFDRPIAGIINFNPAYINSNPNSWETQLATAVHESTHALGFSMTSFNRFRDDYGNTRSSVVQEFFERGHVVAKIVTPRVVAAARNHFGCGDLNGLELEDQGQAGTARSHWETRIMFNEYMTGQLEFAPVFSSLTLAALEDSGWYFPDYTTSDTLYWGRYQGCEFARNKCISTSSSTGRPTPVSERHFCTTSNKGCTVDRAARGSCNVVTYNSAPPSYYQYFGGDPLKGGGAMLADYCPVMDFDGRSDCRSAEYIPPTVALGESWGCKTCRCFLSSLRDVASVFVRTDDNAGCYQYNCTYPNDGPALMYMTTRRMDGSAVRVECPRGGGPVSVPGFSGELNCPPAEEMCPYGNFNGCPNVCSHHGYCQSGTCVCYQGYKGPDCSLRDTLTPLFGS